MLNMIHTLLCLKVLNVFALDKLENSANNWSSSKWFRGNTNISVVLYKRISNNFE